MNWKLIFLLSLFGLGMAFATLSMIPMNVEPFCWLAIGIIYAYFIVQYAPGKYFLHGLCISLVNCVWITAIHMTNLETYFKSHPEQQKMFIDQGSSKPMMALMGIGIGIVSGLVFGLFAFLMGKILKKKAVA
jgi:hypothetical protein